MEVEEVVVLIVFILTFGFVATVALARRNDTQREQRRLGVDPKDLLAQRYASGEIDETEYLMRLSILKDANELTS